MEKINLDFIQNVFRKLAEQKGIPFEELLNGWNHAQENREWNIDYHDSLQQDVENNIENMMQSFKLHSLAMQANDSVTARAALVSAAGFSQMLESIFRDIHDECYKVVSHDARFTWPSIPDDYRIPDHYNYKGPR